MSGSSKKLTEAQIAQAYQRWCLGEAVKVLAFEYGVHYETMRKHLRQAKKRRFEW